MQLGQAKPMSLPWSEWTDGRNLNILKVKVKAKHTGRVYEMHKGAKDFNRFSSQAMATYLIVK